MSKQFIFLCILSGLYFIRFPELRPPQNQSKQKAQIKYQKTIIADSLTIYQSENLIIKKLSNYTYKHISFLETSDYGKVACNGMLVVKNFEGIIFDTPTNDKSSLELINFVAGELKSAIIAVVPTHFHEDCIGGIQEFEKHNIPVYASQMTLELLKKNSLMPAKPIVAFDKVLTLNLGDSKIYAEYFGEGHTQDNIVGYFPEDNAIFGGCLIKDLGSTKGYLGDANLNSWSETVRQVKLKYPEAKIVIPGHGTWGGTELFDYTIALFDLK